MLKAPIKKIVLTGGPGGGKTTAAELFVREYRNRTCLVPETATNLFRSGFPRVADEHVIKLTQSSIYHLQRSLEDISEYLYPQHIHLCDRGTVDGWAYWPSTGEDFFSAMKTTLEQELARYDVVLFFETAAAGGFPIDLGNNVRLEGKSEALALDKKLSDIWSKHPRFIRIPNRPSFLKKIEYSIGILNSLI